jgi:hypothetical protein
VLFGTDRAVLGTARLAIGKDDSRGRRRDGADDCDRLKAKAALSIPSAHGRLGGAQVR